MLYDYCQQVSYGDGEEQEGSETLLTVSPCSPAGGVRAPAAGVGGHGHRGGRGGGRVLV